jgi:ABC-type transport system involved in multi-copper enzyme maturation permease subunit
MFRVFLAEWRKLRRPVLVLGSLASSLFFTVLVTIFMFKNIDNPQGNADRGSSIGRPILESASGSITAVSQVGLFLGITALCIFAAQSAQEYTYGTLRNLLVRQPARLKLLGGKFAAMKSFALLIAVVNISVSIAIGYLLSDGAKVSTDMWFTGEGLAAIGRSSLNIFISIVYFGVFGITLGLIFRSPISSISIGVIWSLILEGLFFFVNENIPNWTPVSQFNTIAAGGSVDISYSHALTLGTSYVFLGAIISAILFAKRDVAN